MEAAELDHQQQHHHQQQHMHHHPHHHHHHHHHMAQHVELQQHHHLAMQHQQHDHGVVVAHHEHGAVVLPQAEPLIHLQSHMQPSAMDAPVMDAVMHQQQHEQLQHAAAELHQAAAAALQQVPDGLQAAVWSAHMQQHGAHQAAMAAAATGVDDGFGGHDGGMGSAYDNGYDDGSMSDGKRTTKKKSKGGRIASEISKEELSACFNMPSEDAAKRLGVGLTVLKRICRKFGVPRWPYRKLKSLDRLIQNVETGVAPGETYRHLMKSADEIRERQKEMCTGNMLDLDDSTKKLQQAYSKFNHKLRKATDKDGNSDDGTPDESGAPKPSKASSEHKRREKAARREAADGSGMTQAQAMAMQHGHMQALLNGDPGAVGDPNMMAYAAMMGGSAGMPFPMQAMMLVDPAYQRAMGIAAAGQRKEDDPSDPNAVHDDSGGTAKEVVPGTADAADAMQQQQQQQQAMAAWWAASAGGREGDPVAYANWLKSVRTTYGYPEGWGTAAAHQQTGVPSDDPTAQAAAAQAAAAAAYAQYAQPAALAGAAQFQYPAGPRGYAGYPFSYSAGYGYAGYDYSGRATAQQAAASSGGNDAAGQVPAGGSDADAYKRRRASPPAEGQMAEQAAAAVAAAQTEAYYAAYPYYRPSWQWGQQAVQAGETSAHTADGSSPKPDLQEGLEEGHHTEAQTVVDGGGDEAHRHRRQPGLGEDHHHHHLHHHEGHAVDSGGGGSGEHVDQATESVAHVLLNMAGVATAAPGDMAAMSAAATAQAAQYPALLGSGVWPAMPMGIPPLDLSGGDGTRTALSEADAKSALTMRAIQMNKTLLSARLQPVGDAAAPLIHDPPVLGPHASDDEARQHLQGYANSMGYVLEEALMADGLGTPDAGHYTSSGMIGGDDAGDGADEFDSPPSPAKWPRSIKKLTTTTLRHKRKKAEPNQS